ncbi:hypothetical protein ACFL6A_04165, partial [bacterium]
LFLTSKTIEGQEKFYTNLVGEKFNRLFSEGANTEAMITIGSGLLSLSRNSPSTLKEIEEVYGAEKFLDLVLANGTLFELFSVLQYTTPEFAAKILDALNDEKAEKLTKKTKAAGRSIGKIHLAMRNLAKTDEEQDTAGTEHALLERLQQRIGAGRFLNLILANGTLIELFRILRRATPKFAVDLLNVSSKSEIKHLIDRTIKAGRSIELHYQLSYCSRLPQIASKLELLISVDQWWHLIRGNGTLYSLTVLRNSMRNVFRSEFTNAANVITVDEWRSLILRSQFRNVCDFLLEEMQLYPRDAQTKFAKGLLTSANEFVAKSSWFDLNSANIPDDIELPESKVLNEAVKVRLNNVKVSYLQGLTLHETVNAIALLWKNRQRFRNQIAAHLWEILPDPKNWQDEGYDVFALRFLLNIARSDIIALKDATLLIDILREPLPMDIYRKIDTLPLFLFYWNLVALWYERMSKMDLNFLLTQQTKKCLIKTLEERIRPKLPNKEKRAILALAGLTVFLHPEERSKIQGILRGNVPGLDYLIEEAMNETFVPAFFTLSGMSLLRKASINFSPLICKQLLEMAAEYEEVGPAIDMLCDKVHEFG